MGPSQQEQANIHTEAGGKINHHGIDMLLREL
jgi:hypothetical protein